MVGKTNLSSLFVDGTLIICKDIEDQVAYLGCILAWFEALSKLRIHLGKSFVLPMGRVETRAILALKLGCQLGSLRTH